VDSQSDSHKIGGLRMFELFLKELATYVLKIKSELEKLKTPQDQKKSLESILKVIREVKSDAGIIQLTSIKELGVSLERLIEKSLETQTALNQEEITLLMRGAHLFAEIAKSNPAELLSQLKLREKMFEELQESLSLQLLKKPLKSVSFVGDKGILELLDKANITPFLQTLKMESVFLNEELSTLESLRPTPEGIDRLLNSARRITEAARQVQIPGLMRLGSVLEAIFEKMRKNAFEFEEKNLDLIFSALDLLTKMAALNSQEFADWIKTNEHAIQTLITDLSGLVEQNFSVESSEKREEGSVVDKAILDLFRVELEAQTKNLNEGILALERSPEKPGSFELLMRAAHSIKGAAKIVGLDSLSVLAHHLEDFFLASKEGRICIKAEESDLLLRTTDFLSLLSKVPLASIESWLITQSSKIEQLSLNLVRLSRSEVYLKPSVSLPVKNVQKQEFSSVVSSDSEYEGVVRVAAQNLNRLLGLAGESMVETRWLQPFSESLNKIKKAQGELTKDLELLRDSLVTTIGTDTEQFFVDLIHKTNQTRQDLTDRLAEFDQFISRHSVLSDKLYYEVIRSRMRPFSDGVSAFSRLVRDLARQVKKNIKLDIQGKSTLVDRDILEKLESPLSHLIRNAVDHGIELPEERLTQGKSAQGTIRLEAEHRAGMLLITVADDGLGLDSEFLRQKIVEENLVIQAIASKLTEKELIEFLFLPGFSTAEKVTELSGRGIGLDIVRNFIQEVSGSVKLESSPAVGTTVTLQLPLTLSVLRALIVEIGEEPYAFPLSRMERFIKIEYESVETIENRQFFKFLGQNIGLVDAAQVLELPSSKVSTPFINVIVIESREAKYGIVVDRFIGERELVIQEIDPLIGKIPNISSGSVMEDGSPVLIIDVEDLINSVDALLTGGRELRVSYTKGDSLKVSQKRVLVVDDSITVREVESRLLRNHGYVVEVALDGIDGWNAVRMNHYDLVITDIDMPRMNGIELIRLIRSDVRLKQLPILIVSYKENESDRLQGMSAGANYYLTKSSFHDDTLLNIVIDLIGN